MAVPVLLPLGGESLGLSFSRGKDGIRLDVLNSVISYIYVYDLISLLFQRQLPLGNIVVTRKENCLLSKCFLVSDTVNGVSTRGRKPLLQEAGWR